MLHQIRKDLYLVDLDQKLDGFRQFISSWIYLNNGVVLIVDPGPSSTIPVLKKALKELGIDRIDYILLTHIHIDHAGGTGHLLKFFPDAKVNCHPKGIDHLVNPEKLWAGSLKVLGNIAEAYGAINPVPIESVSWNADLIIERMQINAVETPGHASHHVCYQIGDLLFAGEVTGVNVPDDRGDYLRIATPPAFKYEIYRESLLRASNLNSKHLCFGHYGFRSDPESIFRKGLDQLELWVALITQNYRLKSDEQIFQMLLESDPYIKQYSKLPEDIKKREEYFCLNSIRGIRGYCESKHR